MRVSNRSKSGLSRGNISFVGLHFLPVFTGLSHSGRVPTLQAENQLVVRMMPRLGVSGLRRQPWRRETVVHDSAVASMRASARDTSGSGRDARALSCSTANGFAAVRLI